MKGLVQSEFSFATTRKGRATEGGRGNPKAAHASVRGFDAFTGMVEHIAGLIRFAGHVDPSFADPLRRRLEAALVQQSWTPQY